MSKKPTYEKLEQRIQELEQAESEHKRVEKEKTKLQNQLQQAQKMEAIGNLAGGIAHKFNNLLSGIMGNIELLKMDCQGDPNITKCADQVLNLSGEMSNLSSQLLAYAKGGKYKSETISFKDFVKNCTPFIMQMINSAIQIETDIPDNILNVDGDQTQMQMLLSVIIENATEALDSKGCIRIVVRNEEVDEKFAQKQSGLKAGSYVCLKVIDDGKGMDEETTHRIFEPFFTTNFQGRGLGMSAVYGIVKNHNGWIGVDSEVGKGTTVSIYLPAVEPQIEKTEKSPNRISINAGTILLIEDEEMVMDVSCAMIEKLGYHVLGAKTAKEAIAIAHTFNGSIDLAILDMGLPDMGGKELYPLLMKNRPELKIIVCSGYSVDGPAQDVLDAGAQAFIQKPYSFAELSVKLRQNIDRRKHKRFKFRKNAVAILKSNPSQQDQIIDISKGGVAYLNAETGARAIRLNEPDELTINLVEDGFSLDNLPCKIISDFTLAGDAPVESIKMRRRGIQFGELATNQEGRLDYVIENHTTADSL